MWPDLIESTEDERYPAPGFTHPDGSQAHLFSSAHPLTVRRHFDWMHQYGIDGMFVHPQDHQAQTPPLPEQAEAFRFLLEK